MSEPRLTVAWIRQQVAAIKEVQADDEAAHSKEDALWAKVLMAIADERCDDPASHCAGEALNTQKLNFARWCA